MRSAYISVHSVRQANARLILKEPVTALSPEVRRLLPSRDDLAKAGERAMREHFAKKAAAEQDFESEFARIRAQLGNSLGKFIKHYRGLV